MSQFLDFYSDTVTLWTGGQTCLWHILLLDWTDIFQMDPFNT